VTDAGRLPAGFVRRELPGGFLLAAERVAAACATAGLDDPERWEALLTGDRGASPGRGTTATLTLRPGTNALLKRMRRGGMAGPLWKDRYAGAGRLLDNLRLPLEVLRRGVPTPEPLALLALRGPGPLFRGWLAVEWLEGARDLASRYAAGEPPTEEELALAMTLVRRMHDAGVEHRDLNLGNLMLRGDAAERRVWVIDLDRARLHPDALPFALRQQALRRLERSYGKLLGERAERGAIGLGPWYELYAGEDSRLLERLRQGSAGGRWRLALHRLTWR
jgi:3-deoxy-D-manno-octulosonic acid kinase